MMNEKQFYCVACRKKVMLPASDICVKVYKNKKTGTSPALVGQCKCGTNVTKFIKRDSVAAMRQKYGSCR